VNFCLPLIATNTDKLKKGLQLGLGFNFWWTIIYFYNKNRYIYKNNIYI
jgi:hypothetical protein